MRPGTPARIRNPTAKPTPTMRAATKTFRTRSARVRPPRTAERDIGSERKRSSSPLCKSVASPIDVPMAPNTVVCTKMPGIR